MKRSERSTSRRWLAATLAVVGCVARLGSETDGGSGPSSASAAAAGTASSAGGGGQAGAVSATAGTSPGAGSGGGGGQLSSAGSAGSANGGSGGTAGGDPAPAGGAAGEAAGGAPGGGLAAEFPCDGTTSGYDVVVTNQSGPWLATRAGDTLYSGSSMREAMQAGINGLTANRTSKQSVLVQGSGSISANERVELGSYTVLNVCGTIDVTAGGSGDKAPIYARNRKFIDIPNVSISGAPLYGMFFRDVDDLHIGNAELVLTNGLGIRIDNHGRSDRSDKVDRIALDYAYIEGSGAQAVETYGANDVTIGTIVARDVGESGLLLNDSTNVEVELVDAINAGTGTGYAAFRTANDNGNIDGEFPTNIHVGKVIARGGGRGIFCVTRSGGILIDEIDIEDVGNDSILIQNCHNVEIAAVSGKVTGGGNIRLGFDSQGCSSCANSTDIVLGNLTVSGTDIVENPCADSSTFANISLLDGASMDVCN